MPKVQYNPKYETMPKTVIVIPAHNEEKNIGRTIDLIRATGLPVKIVVVDDGSNDNTIREVLKRRLLGRYADGNAEVILTQLDRNRGKGVAFFKGMRTALQYNPEAVIFLDADMLEVPKQSLYFLAKNAEQHTQARESAMVIGNQYEKMHPFLPLFYKTRPDIVGMYAFSSPACLQLMRDESRVLAKQFELETYLRGVFRDRLFQVKEARFKTLAPWRHISSRDQEEQFLSFEEKLTGKLRRRTEYKNKKEKRLFERLRTKKLV